MLFQSIWHSSAIRPLLLRNIPVKDTKKVDKLENSHRFFNNHSCKYFPCHNTPDCMTNSQFNCLFCFCPLYHLDDCGGKFTYSKTESAEINSIKLCMDCHLPHMPEYYDIIIDKLRNCQEIT